VEIGFVLFPRLAPLDLAGPFEVLTRLPGANAHLVWTRPGPVLTERGMEINATTSFEDAPPLDVLVVPGGPGQLPLMRHVPLLEFLRAQLSEVRFLCGVCTGALLIGQAGLLRGRKATTHWEARAALASLGAEVLEERYVFDGNLVTAAGVSAGIDMALALVARLAGEPVARSIQAGIEYDPQPPFGPVDWAWVQQAHLKDSMLGSYAPAIQKVLAGRPELLAKLLP
jgi:cyclohexyl-isocyanide hydratase